MLDDPDVRSRPVPNLGTKVALLAAVPFLAYGIYLLLTPITDITTGSGAVFECGSALQVPSDKFQKGVCGPINTQYLYEGLAFIAAALGIAGGGALLFGFTHHEEHARVDAASVPSAESGVQQQEQQFQDEHTGRASRARARDDGR